MFSIYKKELHSYFTGVIAAVISAFLLLVCGIFTVYVCLQGHYPNFEIVLADVPFIFVMIVPILTMRSFADEKNLKTDQLLFSLPIRGSSIVLGKYLAMLTTLFVPCAIMGLYPFILSLFGKIYFPTIYGTLLAVFLLGALLCAIGMFISSVSDSQIIAAVLTVAALLLLYLVNGVTEILPSTAAASFAIFIVLSAAVCFILYFMTKNITLSAVIGALLIAGETILFIRKKAVFEGAVASWVGKLAVFDSISNFIYGSFDLSVIVYYLSIAALFVFFTVQSVEKRRWS